MAPTHKSKMSPAGGEDKKHSADTSPIMVPGRTQKQEAGGRKVEQAQRSQTGTEGSSENRLPTPAQREETVQPDTSSGRSTSFSVSGPKRAMTTNSSCPGNTEATAGSSGSSAATTRLQRRRQPEASRTEQPIPSDREASVDPQTNQDFELPEETSFPLVMLLQAYNAGTMSTGEDSNSEEEEAAFSVSAVVFPSAPFQYETQTTAYSQQRQHGRFHCDDQEVPDLIFSQSILYNCWGQPQPICDDRMVPEASRALP